MAITITIAEDDFFVREGLIALLDTEPNIEVVAACGDLESLLASVEADAPDVVVTDVRMPPLHTDEGIRAAQHLRHSHPSVGVVVLSQYDDPAYVLTLFDDGSQGRGYLLKERITDVAQLVAAIESVAQGGSAVDPIVVDALVARQGRRSPLKLLTPRETEVLAHMAQGKDNGAIAAALDISTRAVEKHNGSIFAKLALTDAAHTDKRVRAVLLFLDAGSGND